MARPTIGDRAMSTAERAQRFRAKRRAARGPIVQHQRRRIETAPSLDLRTLEPEAIATRIVDELSPEAIERIVRVLNQRLTHWRVGSFDPNNPFVTGGGARNVG